MRDACIFFVLYPARVRLYHCIMKSGWIRLGECLEQMEQLDEFGKPKKFQMRFVTANRNLGTGGEIIEIEDGRKCVGKRNGSVVHDTRKAYAEVPALSKDPHHWINSTRNILLPNGQIRKVHIRLIIEFNHQKVCF
jgi:hypothetical protein